VTIIPSGLATQSIGEAVPVQFPLRFASVYLVEGNDGWTLVDAGYDYPRGER
jgi:glyoxylase-like metal-dependent hydrolase (beta-lactamase superfamily II)